MTDIVVWLLLIAGAIALLLAIATGKLSSKGNNFAALTSFHDFQPKDRREAIETIVEKQAAKRWAADETGKGTGDENKNMDPERDPELNNDKPQ